MPSTTAYLWVAGFKASFLPPQLGKTNCFLHTFISKQMPLAPLHEQNLHSIASATRWFKNAIYSRKASTGTLSSPCRAFPQQRGVMWKVSYSTRGLTWFFPVNPSQCCIAVGEKAAGAPRAPTVPGRLQGGCMPAPAAWRWVRIRMLLSCAGWTTGLFACAQADFPPHCEAKTGGEEWQKGDGGKGDWNKEPVVKSETAEKSRIVPDGLFLNWLTRTWCVVWVRILCQLKNWDSHGMQRTVHISIFFLLLMYSDQTPNKHACSPAAARNPEHWAWKHRHWSFFCSDFPAAWWLATSWRPGPSLWKILFSVSSKVTEDIQRGERAGKGWQVN